MSKLWLVARHEYKRHVARKGFVAAVLSLPTLIVVIALVAGGIALVRGRGPETHVAGYVDQAGLLIDQSLLPADGGEADVHLIAYQTEDAAAADLASGVLEGYFVVAEDYAATSRVRLVAANEPDGAVIRHFRALLQESLLVDQPATYAKRAIAGSNRTWQSSDGHLEFSGRLTPADLTPALASIVFVVLIFMSSGYLTQAVVEEKTNRTMEILVTSLSPRQLAGGKLLGILAVTGTMLVAWAAFAAVGILLGGKVFGVAWLQDIHLDARSAMLLAALLVPAYLFVAALMTAMGTAFAEARGNQQIVAVFLSVYMVPMGLILPVLSTPASPLAVGLSLFPLTAPVMLPLRLSLTQVPDWQIAASIAIQVLMALGALWLMVRSLQIGLLRSGKRVRWQEILGLARREKQAAPGGREGSRATAAARSNELGPLKTARRGARKAFLVFRYELFSAVRRPVYLLLIVGLPVFVFLNALVMGAAIPGGSSRQSNGEAEAQAPLLPTLEAQGYVDASGLIQIMPESLPDGALLAYPDEASGRQALAQGEIAALHLIPADYVATGALVTVRPDLNRVAARSSADWMDVALLLNLMGGNRELAGKVGQPMDLQRDNAPQTEPGAEMDEDNIFALLLTRYLPAVIMLLLYGMIALSGGMLMGSVSDEKKNRVMEVLLLAVSTRQMVSGKVVALGLAGLLQAIGWVCVSYLLFQVTGVGGSLPEGLRLPGSLLLWSVVFFLLGYGIYACLMAGAGALLPNVKESPMVSLFFYAPAFVGFEISLFSTGNPHGLLPTIASLFPLTAPFSMINRLVVGGVPAWQLLLSVGLMVITIPLIVRAVARMFRAQVLLSSQPFTIKRYLRVLVSPGA